MPYFEIEGGHRLNGSLTPQGAKNEALQVICATLLTDQPVTIRNIPEILDVKKLIGLLEDLGVRIEKKGSGHYVFCAQNADPAYLETDAYFEAGQKIRGSIMMLSPLLIRWGFGIIPSPGGDKIGRRRLDTHLTGLQKLGAEFIFDRKRKQYRVEGKKLNGTFIHQDEASVTGTANLIMAAVKTPGQTVIYNAACEPYIQQLCSMLQQMGAQISGIGSNMLTIQGVEELAGCDHTCMPDMIEIGSFIGLAAMTQSDITIKDAGKASLGIIPQTFKQLGVQMSWQGDDLRIPAQDSYEVETYIDGSIMTVSDAPWPGFTPDLISIALVVATQAKGNVLIHQKMFESRLFFVDHLLDMGAQIILCDPHRATVMGLGRRYPLQGVPVRSPDIRAGVALLIAALSAEGKSTIYNIGQIDRGYQSVDDRLNALGAKIIRYEDGN